MRNPDQLRHILKTISWRVVGTIDTMVISYLITGSVKVGMAIGGFEVFTKMVLYYFHERVWFNYVSLGRSTSATSQSTVSSSKSEVLSNEEEKESQMPVASSQRLETRNQKPETHIVHQSYSITLQDRIQKHNHAPKVFWMTGLSGSGKSTIANALQNELFKQGYQVYVLDGDNVRGGLNKDLDFSEEGRIENIRRISEVAKLFSDAGFVVITAFISPFRSDRQQAREIIGDNTFCEVFVDTPLEVCEQRDVKGLYKKARAGEIKNFTGIGSPFEVPEAAEVVLSTQNLDLGESIQILQKQLATGF